MAYCPFTYRLLQVGFGSSGADIIGKNMSSGDGDLNIMLPGLLCEAVFGFCDVRNFTGITVLLEEDIMLFINTVGRIVQACVAEWRGFSNKNLGDAFLVVWKTPTENVTESARAESDISSRQVQKTC